MTDSIWDDPEIKSSDEFIKFESAGDTVTGTVLAVKKHTFDDGKVVPQLLLRCSDGEERTLTAGQIQLKAKLSELRPHAGDVITVTFTQEEKRSGGKTLKHFEVVMGGTGAAAPASAPVAAAAEAQAPIDPQAAAAALANLTPEQRQALGIPA